MIRWILIIILVIVLILAVVFVFRRITAPSSEEADVPAEIAGNGENAGQAPNVIGDSFATSAGQAVSGNVLSNDTDPQNDTLTAESVPTNGPTNGILILAVDGNFTYTPNAEYVGVDSFTYRVCDPNNNCSIGFAQITINSSADAMANEDSSNTTAEGGGEAQPADGNATTSGGGTGEVQPADGNATTSGGGTGEVQPADGSATTGDSANANAQPADSSGNATGSEAQATDSSTADGTSGSSAPPANTAGQSVTDPATHVVKQGEWLIQVGRCYGTAPETIVSQNYIPYPGWIMPNESLTISGIGSVSEPFFEPCIMFYTVKEGDTLSSISQTFKVDLDMLLKANYGCYGYGYYYPYSPPVVTPHTTDPAQQSTDGGDTGWYMDPLYVYGPGYGAHSPYIYTGCYAPYYDPVIYVGQELVIPVNLENANMRVIPAPVK